MGRSMARNLPIHQSSNLNLHDGQYMNPTYQARATFLSFSPPAISEEEIAAVVDTLRSDWITTGPKTKQFETDFADYIGAQTPLAVNSCTGALHGGLAALPTCPGSEVTT